MRAKEIESYVRQYAPVSLVLEISKGADVLNPEGFDAFLDGESLALSTTLGQINRFIESEAPDAKPKWIRDGRVLSDSLSMADLISDKDLHPNRTGESFEHQIELLRVRVVSAASYHDVDVVYQFAYALAKRFTESQQLIAIYEVLQHDSFFTKAFNDVQRMKIHQLCE